MIAFDTDHLTVLTDAEHSVHQRLLVRLRSVSEPVAIPLVSVEEQLRGWLARIHRTRKSKVDELVWVYDRLFRLFSMLKHWDVLPFNRAAAQVAVALDKKGMRIGTMDVRIAATALAHDATLLTGNLRHFRQVPNLRAENWLE